MNVYLIGYRGTGKSTLARLIARRLGEPWRAVDLDVEVERRAGKSIAEIFAENGEAEFRRLESEALAAAANQEMQVVATGGGIIGAEANRRLLKSGCVVWLAASVESIERRLQQDGARKSQRPALTLLPSRLEIETMLAQREPTYRELAELIVATDVGSPEQLAGAVAGRLKQLRFGANPQD